MEGVSYAPSWNGQAKARSVRSITCVYLLEQGNVESHTCVALCSVWRTSLLGHTRAFLGEKHVKGQVKCNIPEVALIRQQRCSAYPELIM